MITPRTNEPGIPEEFCEDIEELMRFENVAKCIDGICVPKINNLDDLEYVDNALAAKEQEFQWEEERMKLVIQIESAEALINMKEIFRYDRQLDIDDGKGRIIAAAFGADDFTADMGIHRDDDYTKLDFARRMFALNCAAFGIISIDTPYVQYKDQEGLK